MVTQFGTTLEACGNPDVISSCPYAVSAVASTPCMDSPGGWLGSDPSAVCAGVYLLTDVGGPMKVWGCWYYADPEYGAGGAYQTGGPFALSIPPMSATWHPDAGDTVQEIKAGNAGFGTCTQWN